MRHKHFVVVVYDISNNKRRTKLHKRLQDFGIPVQFSVFECALTAVEMKKMQSVILKLTKPKVDHIRIYHLCAACRAKIQVIGREKTDHDVEIHII